MDTDVEGLYDEIRERDDEIERMQVWIVYLEQQRRNDDRDRARATDLAAALKADLAAALKAA